MSEILSEQSLTAIGELHEYRQETCARDMARLLASHRQLQQERDALKAELEHWTFASFRMREAVLRGKLEEIDRHIRGIAMGIYPSDRKPEEYFREEARRALEHMKEIP